MSDQLVPKPRLLTLRVLTGTRGNGLGKTIGRDGPFQMRDHLALPDAVQTGRIRGHPPLEQLPNLIDPARS